ncbi:MAG: hypothetical protein VKP62_00010 [Candidatus Sericytochromatia bacterium]|nr:hypothetical protein [Candidatus Sericytochromatia bacterium]
MAFVEMNQASPSEVNSASPSTWRRASVTQEWLDPSPRELNRIFAALLGSSVFVFSGGHILLRDAGVFVETLPVAMACLGILVYFYSLSFITGSVPWGLLATYGSLLGLVYGPRPLFGAILFGGCGIGAYLIATKLRLRREDWLGLVLMAATAAALILDCGFSPFDVTQRVNAGLIHRDTLFHASIAAMIKNYGITSTGLHGLIFTPYHVLSHTLMASISLISGGSILLVYGVAQWVLFAPLLIFCTTYATTAITKVEHDDIPSAWLLTCTALALLPWLVDPWTLVHHNPFISESYVLSMGLFFIGMKPLFQERLDRRALCFVLVLSGMLAYAKSPVGVIYSGLWGLRALLLPGATVKRTWICFALATLIVGGVTFETAYAIAAPKLGASISIEWFHHIRNYGYLGEQIIQLPGSQTGVRELTWRSVGLTVASLGIFFGLHFCFSWWVLLRNVMAAGPANLWKTPTTLYTLGSLGAGLLMVTFVKLQEGTAYFFYNPAFYVALPLWISWCLSDGQILRQKVLPSRFEPIIARAGRYTLIIVTWALLTPLNFYEYRSDPNFIIKQAPLVKSLVRIRDELPISVTLNLSPGTLDKTLLRDCVARPFLYPALSERPWANLLNQDEDCEYRLYLFPLYGLTPSNRKLSNVPVRLEKTFLIPDSALSDLTP